MYSNPQSEIEKILAKALDKENIAYECQYPIYNRIGDLQPKYTLDFCIKADKKIIAVECDGEAYHKDIKKDTERTAYLYSKGITILLRFTTTDIKYNVNYCINEIKRYINLYSDIKYSLKCENTEFCEQMNHSKDWVYNYDQYLPEVELFAVGFALSYDRLDCGIVMTMLIDSKSKRKSEIRYKIYDKTTQKECDTIAVLAGLQRLNRSSQIWMHTTSRFLCNVCNSNVLVEKSKNLDNREAFNKIAEELKKHNYHFVYVQKDTKGTIDNPIFRDLLSRSKQLLYNYKRNMKPIKSE